MYIGGHDRVRTRDVQSTQGWWLPVCMPAKCNRGADRSCARDLLRFVAKSWGPSYAARLRGLCAVTTYLVTPHNIFWPSPD